MRSRVLRLVLVALILVLGLEIVLQVAHLLAPTRAIKVSDPQAPTILCLGDSHTFGAGVAPEDAYPAQLAQKLRGQGYAINVVNLGAPGYNTSELRRRLPDWLSAYSPAVVIVLAGVNDGWNRADVSWSEAEDGLPVPFGARLTDFLTTRVRIVHGLTVIIHRLDWTRAPRENVRDRAGAPVLHQGDTTAALEPPQLAYDRARRNLVAMIALIRANRALPVLMTYVASPELTFETPNHLLREVASSMQVPLADNDLALAPLFIRPDRAVDPKMRAQLFLPDMHPKAQGYNRISENILATLKKSGILAALPKP